MAEKREKLPIYKTPVGIAQYPRLVKPDTKFNAAGEYKISLILDAKDAAEIMKMVDDSTTAMLAKVKAENPKEAKLKQIKLCEDKPYSAVTNDDGDETGKVKINFKMKAKITSQKTGDTWTQRPDLFDAKGKVLVNPNIGGGSAVKVAFELFPFWTKKIGVGTSLRLKAVQVITLVEYTGGKDAAGYGFAEEEGYDASEAPATEEPEDKAEGEETPDRAADDETEF